MVIHGELRHLVVSRSFLLIKCFVSSPSHLVWHVPFQRGDCMYNHHPSAPYSVSTWTLILGFLSMTAVVPLYFSIYPLSLSSVSPSLFPTTWPAIILAHPVSPLYCFCVFHFQGVCLSPPQSLPWLFLTHVSLSWFPELHILPCNGFGVHLRKSPWSGACLQIYENKGSSCHCHDLSTPHE